jgi:hypothetical protein
LAQPLFKEGMPMAEYPSFYVFTNLSPLERGIEKRKRGREEERARRRKTLEPRQKLGLLHLSSLVS